MRSAALLFSLALAACTSSGGGSGAGGGPPPPPPPPPHIQIGAFVSSSGGACQNSVPAFEASLGRKLDIVASYPGWGPWGKNYGTFVSCWQWIAKDGRTPLIVWSARVGINGCVLLTDILAHKHDSDIDTNAAAIKTLGVHVLISLLAEPTTNPPSKCSNPAQDSKLYVAAWQYIVARFAADGVAYPDVTWVQALGQPLFDNGTWADWYAGNVAVNILGEDTYNATNKQESFSANICKLTQPIAIAETGAQANEQAAWLGNVKAACSNLTFLIYFDAVGNSGLDYRITTPDAFATLSDVGQ